MKFTVLSAAIRHLIVRHQSAVTGAVFFGLALAWGVMLWSTPQREVQAAPFHPSAFALAAAGDADPQVGVPNDSLRPQGTRSGMQGDTSARSLNSRQIPADSAAQTGFNAAFPDSLQQDSLHVTLTKADSARIDSMRRVPRDSSARLEQFHYKRSESVMVLPIAPRGYSMFLKQPSLVQTTATLDSTGRFVIIRQTVGGKDVRIPVRMPLNEYIAERFKAGITRNFEELVLKNEDVKKRDDLSELLTSFTNIDIPIPANPVFSIFGPPRINLHISGAVDIRAAFRNTSTDQITTSALGNSRNEPDFAQEVQINVSGTIGDKLNINADWNTQRQFEYENQLKIKYTGYEDEIVQNVEAGNVSLPTNSKFISSSSALFGIKAQFQLGPLRLTAIASQKKGQVQEKTITGGSSEVPFEKKAYDYSKDHFFVDTVYRQYYENYVRKSEVNNRLQINEAEVWMTTNSADLTNVRKGIAYMDLDSTYGDPKDYGPKRQLNHQPQPGLEEEGSWIKLEEGKDYTINKQAGYITLNRSSEGFAVAIAYRVDGETESPKDDYFFGTLESLEGDKDSVRVFKLIKPKSLLPQFKEAWRMMMRNFYPLGGRNIKKEGFTLDIVYRGNTNEPTPKIQGTNILQLFGLDNFSDDGSSNPDGRFDYTRNVTIDEERGELIFPSLEPFRDGLSESFAKYGVTIKPDSFVYPQVYDTTVFAAQNNAVKDRFVITGKTSAGSSNTINLGFNIVEGSVQVLMNGQPLVPNVDYTIDYIIGQVIIKNQAALVPGSNLSVKFEQNDLFQLASKTLLGLRGDMNLSERTQLGFTMMSLDQQTLSDKVRLGEEPMKNAIYGIDGKTGADLAFLTKAIDALPFISTKEKSDINVFGEAAYMSPDPNTKKSPIAIDGGKSIAYVDDFEGAKRTIPLGVNYGMWHDASAPAYIAALDSAAGTPLTDLQKSFLKGRAYWYNVLPSNVTIDQIYGDKKTVAKGQEFLTVLTLNYDPRKRGEYNYSPTLTNHFGPAASADSVKKNWAGIQRVLSTSALDLVRENINFIELWVKIDSLSGSANGKQKVYIDLGAISEDVIANGKVDSEDKEVIKNGILNEGEDTGLDGENDAAERSKHADFLNANNTSAFPELNGDPAGDNWSYTTGDYRFVNGTENNSTSEIGKFPDTEDLNHNNVIDRTNSYFEYELDLDTESPNPQRVGGGLGGWYQYRIPLTDFKSKVGVPDFSLIEYVRLWMTGTDQATQIRIYDFNLVGNQWEEMKKNDSAFVVSTINVEDNQNYISPPGVIRERDKSQTDAVVLGNEQSLLMKITDLKGGQERHAIKRFTYKTLDMFNYKQLKMFMHGSPNFSRDSGKIIVKFGRDTLNYYEYRAPIGGADEIARPSGDLDAQRVWPFRNNIVITFSELTKVKQGRDSSQLNKLLDRPVPATDGPPGATYNICGNPDLTRIAFISVGVENPNGTGAQPLTGEVWINELRLVDVDNTPGWAYSISATLKLADLATVAFTYSRQDPFFHQLETAFGSRLESVNWNLTASISLEKFLPTSWAGSSFPFTYSHTEGFSTPRYLPASDVEVSKAAGQQRDLILADTLRVRTQEEAEYEYRKLIFESQTIRISDSYALPTFKLNMPYDSWYVQDIINKMQFGFTYNTSFDRAPQKERGTAWNWQATFGYAYTFNPDLFFMPFEFFTDVPMLNSLKDLKVFFPFTNFSLKFATSRGQIEEKIRNQLRQNPLQRTFTASRGLSFGWKLTENGFLNLSGDYSVDIASTLVHLETNPNGSQRGFLTILDHLVMGDQLISFGIDNSYLQNLNINMRPRVPDIFEINKYLTLNARYGVGYSWSNNLQLGELGKSTRWSSNISVGTDFSLKQFADSWWPAPKEETVLPGQSRQNTAPSRRRDRDDEDTGTAPVPAPTQTEGVTATDTVAAESDTLKAKVSVSEKILNFARIVIKTPLLDFDKINISFTETNSASNTGVPGRPGFANFFSRVPFFQDGVMSYGPTWAYQMGLTSDPTANISGVTFKSKFPFIGFDTKDRLRRRALLMPANSTLPESFNQNNKLSLKTNRDLWEGARIDLNWNLGWDYARTQSIRIDSNHVPVIASLVTGGSIERSFFTIPVFSSLLKSNLAEVAKIFKEGNQNVTEDRRLAEAFEKGMETLPFLTKLFGQYMPRMNYTFRWDGLEKYSVFTSWATRVSLDHAYQSSYRRTFKGDPSGIERTESQRVMYGFAPLLGMSFTFKELLKGNMSANLRYSSNATYDLMPASKTIAETGSREISVTASYGRSGFEIPFFGLALNNDVDISFSYSYAKSSRRTYAVVSSELDAAGTPGEGSSRTTMEPRIKYVLSARVTASLFYRYTKIAPDEGGSRIPGSSTNEGGVDVHIAIQ